MLTIGELLDHRNQVEKTIGQVEGNDTAGLHVLDVNSQRFIGQQMNGYRIARKGVDGKQIEPLRRLALQVQPRVAERRLDGRVAVPEIGEVAIGDDYHRRIDVVEAVDIPF